MKFTIDRNKWLRGKGYRNSRLLRGDGKMCCMGHVCLQLGATKDQILNVAVVSAVAQVDPGFAQRAAEAGMVSVRMGSTEEQWVCDAYHLNDNQGLTESEREHKLAERFKCAGHEIEFIN